MLMLVQRYVGRSINPTLTATIGAMDAALVRRWQATGNNGTPTISSGNQIATWSYVAIVY